VSSAAKRRDERKPPRFPLITFKMREVSVEELGLEKAAGVRTA
jgi:hypothetical protein